MKLSIQLTSMEKRAVFDVSEIAAEPVWVTSITGQRSSFTMNLLDNDKIFVKKGDIVEAFQDGKKFFKGRVFERSKTKNKLWKIIAFDNMRYLDSEDTIVFKATTAAERFETIAKAIGVPYKIGMRPSYKCAAAVCDGQTYYTMLSDALDETRKRANNSRYTIFDDAGTLRFVALEELNTPFILGDESLVTDYDYSETIDESINSVKVVRDDDKNKTRQVYQAKDTKTITAWGLLQKVEKPSDSKLNAQQLQAEANAILRENKEPKQTLSLESLGRMEIRAGSSFTLKLKDLDREWGNRTRVALAKNVTHTFMPYHTMQIECEVVY